MITREDAVRIGSSEIVTRGLGIGAREAFLIGELRVAPALYGGPDLDDCWIVYAEREDLECLMLRSSDIVLVSHKTGEVLYAGSAHNEG